ncbi:hypothetical protein J0910_04470 [Nocardiopsis sp. CNT-189]|uniref:hypothetical protein n=1 Tax=Nocardiopsis oceanisediminis TaxID=2816862 RepID=UPI003B29F3EA
MHRPEEPQGNPPDQGTSTSNRVSGDRFGTVIQVGAVHGDVQSTQLIQNSGTIPQMVRQVPPVTPHFVNRGPILDAMREIISQAGGRTALICLYGMGGVGKSGLASRFLYELQTGNGGAGRDGNLFYDLRGFSPDKTAGPSDVLEVFLRSLGVPPAAIPPGLPARASWWRSISAGKSFGILLDNAVSAAQVRSLLPGEGAHVVVATARDRLAGLTLDGGRLLRVDPLDNTDATKLLLDLTRAADADAETDEASASRVAELCGGLPIAVNAVGVHTAEGLTLADAETELSRLRDRLSVLSDAEEESVQAAFDFSYDALPPDAARAYRRLGRHVGPDVTVSVARALVGGDERECARLLRSLASASMLTDLRGGRYRFHDLLALHAQGKAAEQEAESRTDALRHLAEEFARDARAADRALRPYVRANRGGQGRFADSQEALLWLDRERENLIAIGEYAAGAGLASCATAIAEGFWPLYLRRRDASGWLRAGDAALRVATDKRLRARLLSKQGLTLGFLGLEEKAQEALTRSAALWEELEEPEKVAQVRQRRGLLALGAERPEEALGHLRAARALQERAEVRNDLGVTLLAMGRALNRLGGEAEAVPLLRRAHGLLEAGENIDHALRARIALARAATDEDDLPEARAALDEALAEASERGSETARAEALEALGDLAARAGDTERAVEHYSAAVEALYEMGAEETIASVRERMSALPPAPDE